MWFNAGCQSQDTLPRWKAGDVVGCFIDIDNKMLVFSLNGSQLQPFSQVFQSTSSAFFPAASFMSFQQCEFNFGWRPFSHPPDTEFQSFNKVSQTMSQLSANYNPCRCLHCLKKIKKFCPDLSSWRP